MDVNWSVMSDRSAIEWTDATWNPVRGCTKVSPGCKFCYAEVFSERFRGVPGHPFEQGFDLRLVPEKLEQPLHWRRPRKIFVNSMSDLFHEDVPTDYIGRVGEVMRRADWHLSRSSPSATSDRANCCLASSGSCRTKVIGDGMARQFSPV
jgi:protein gp37